MECASETCHSILVDKDIRVQTLLEAECLDLLQEDDLVAIIMGLGKIQKIMERLVQLLEDYPIKSTGSELSTGFTNGFQLHYNDPRVKHRP